MSDILAKPLPKRWNYWVIAGAFIVGFLLQIPTICIYRRSEEGVWDTYQCLAAEVFDCLFFARIIASLVFENETKSGLPIPSCSLLHRCGFTGYFRRSLFYLDHTMESNKERNVDHALQRIRHHAAVAIHAFRGPGRYIVSFEEMRMSRVGTFGLFVAALVLCSCSVQHTQRAQEGQPILRAIYQYAEETGSYPTNLAVLAPKYLAVAPVEDWKRGWHYGPADSRGITNGFVLSRWSTGYKTRIEYIDDGTMAGWRVNAEGDKTPLNLPSMKSASIKKRECKHDRAANGS